MLRHDRVVPRGSAGSWPPPLKSAALSGERHGGLRVNRDYRHPAGDCKSKLSGAFSLRKQKCASTAKPRFGCYGLGEVHLVSTLLTTTALVEWRSSGVITAKFSGQVVAFRRSLTVFAGTPVAGSALTRI